MSKGIETQLVEVFIQVCMNFVVMPEPENLSAEPSRKLNIKAIQIIGSFIWDKINGHTYTRVKGLK